MTKKKLTKKQIKIMQKEILKGMAKILASDWTNGSSMQTMRGYDRAQVLPDEVEMGDFNDIKDRIERYLDKKYPLFEPEVIYGVDKEYFLPALKVLKRKDNKYYSPQHTVEWVDGELKAECFSRQYYPPQITYNTFTNEMTTIVPDKSSHIAPDETCECGVYGSVHLEEIYEYLYRADPSGQLRNMARHSIGLDDYYPDEPEFVLCLIEPSPDAKVILCRKGWRASHAFISEIIGESIDVGSASRLLSIAWHREIDIRRIYENR